MMRILMLIAIIPTAIYAGGCGPDQPRVVQETEDQTFENLTDLAAQESEQSESQEH